MALPAFITGLPSSCMLALPLTSYHYHRSVLEIEKRQRYKTVHNDNEPSSIQSIDLIRAPTLDFSGSKREHQFGTGFIVRESLVGSVLTFKPVNERLCYIRLKGQQHNYSLVAAHAPTEEKEEQVKDNFFKKLEELINNLPKQDMYIILGDLNAKIGKEAAYKPTIGSHSFYDVSNDNGTRLIDFAASYNLLIKSTLFEHKKIQKQTWVSNDGVTRNQIDHVLVDARRGSNSLDVRSLRGADSDTDHFLVKAKIRTRIASKKTHNNTPTQLWNTEVLRNKETEQKFQKAIKIALTQTEDYNNIDSAWKNIKLALTSVSDEILGYKKKTTEKWFDYECLNYITARNMARKNMLQNPSHSNNEMYRQRRTETRKLMKRKKMDYKEQIIRDIEEKRKNKQAREFFKGVSDNKTGYQARTRNFLQNDSGQLITDDKEILKTWKEYFYQLLNDQSRRNTSNIEVHTAEIEDRYPTYEEVIQAIKKLKNNKTPGSDGIPAECLKHGEEALYSSIYKLIQDIWREETMPDEWK
ncbi:uncharacterized protein [Diabrotica undecimpunctata]|uniref:uncharacterized protein n=1 Tax=Diabrotica undecimpunctata TaxID=50387 RepID=UPI003B6402EF